MVFSRVLPLLKILEARLVQPDECALLMNFKVACKVCLSMRETHDDMKIHGFGFNGGDTNPRQYPPQAPQSTYAAKLVRVPLSGRLFQASHREIVRLPQLEKGTHRILDKPGKPISQIGKHNKSMKADGFLSSPLQSRPFDIC